MTDLSVTGYAAGADLGTVSVTANGQSDSAPVPSFRSPATVTGIPRVSSSQTVGDTLTMDVTGIAGIVSQGWREVGGSVLGTATTLDSSTHVDKWIEPFVNNGSEIVGPPVFIYSTMMAEPEGGDTLFDYDALATSMTADDKIVTNLFLHSEATHIAVADGNWNDSATWINGRVPRFGARWLIPNGIEVTYNNQTVGIRMDKGRVDGKLTFSQVAGDYQVLIETLVITRGGAFECGTFSSPIPANVTHDIVISDRCYTTDSRQPTVIDLVADPELMGRGLISQGERVIWGDAKTSWGRCAVGANPDVGDTSSVMEFDVAAANWQVGDRIVIGGTGSEGTFTSEERILTSVGPGGAIEWSGACEHSHDVRNPNVTRTDLRCGIANMTRNVVIRSENENLDRPWLNGHTMDMHMAAKADVWNVEHRYLGRTRKGVFEAIGRKDGNGDFEFVPIDNSGVTTETFRAESNIKSRYAMHCHMLGFDKAFTDVFNGCSVSYTPGWAMVHHHCEAIMNACVIYDFGGGGMVSETGDEVGMWLGNFICGSKEKHPEGPKTWDFTEGDFFKNGTGMCFRSRALIMNSNFMMDCSWVMDGWHRENQASITRRINLLTAHTDLADIGGFANRGRIRIADSPLTHANGNEGAGVYGGLHIEKEGPAQDHGFSVNIERFKCWEVSSNGMLLAYVGQYRIGDADLVSADVAGTIGINLAQNAHVMSLVNPVTERFGAGIALRQSAVPDVVSGDYNNTTNPRFMIVNHTSNNDTVAVDNDETFSHTRTWASEPTYSEVSVNIPDKIGEWNGSAISAVPTGLTLTDTVGTTDAIKTKDQMGIPVNSDSGSQIDALNYASNHGYYMLDGTTPIMLIPYYWSDRLTGIPIKTYHYIEITGGAESGYTNNGSYSFSANAPVIAPQTMNIGQAGGTLDVAALATDADPDTLTLSGSFLRPDNCTLEVSGGSITVEPVLSFTGANKAWVWVEDQAGNATRCPITINVT